MTNFGERRDISDQLETPFMEAFNSECKTHQIFPFGLEATALAHMRERLRKRYDPASQFLRYLPDALMIPRSEEGPSRFIDFKHNLTGVKKDSFYARLKEECPDMDPPFSSKEDVFNIESEALDFYLDLHEINVPVIVVGYAAYRTDNPLRAQYAGEIAVCNEYNPNKGAGTTGSGTIIKNTNFASFVPLVEFFSSSEFGIDEDSLQAIEDGVKDKLNKRQ